MSRPLAVLTLLFCTLLWGFAFIAQKSGVTAMGPLTFAAVRYLVGGIVILPFALVEYRKAEARQALPTRRQWWLFGFVTAVFFAGSWLQNAGLLYTTVTNGGFLTSLYVLFVPLIAFGVARLRPHPIIFIGVPLALIGIYFLNGGGLDTFNVGDILLVGGAVFWGFHVYSLAVAVQQTHLPVVISAVTFIGAGIVSLVLAFGLEAPSWDAIVSVWPQFLYAGVLSTALAFTLQAIGQRYVPPANAAIILSAESLFAALGGAWLLGERLPLVGYAGAALIFVAIVMVEVVPALQQRRVPTGAA